MTKYLITGGTGSLGRAIINKLLKNKKNKVIVYSRDEGKQALFFGHNKKIIRVIGDIRDFEKLNVTMQLHKPDYVIHAAALKRVDDMEFHPDECVKTNIVGSENVARSSLINGVKKCILVSTDKACQPVNVYGSSKFIAERFFTNFDHNSSSTIFASVRYGNVIASRGSFIPLWLAQAKDGKKITVTSEKCTRFLFTLGDAVDTVLNALEQARGGEVFVPQIDSYELPACIKAIEKILNKDVSYEVIGIRPGEKLHEDMLCKTELSFTYVVDNMNLLQIRPQYTTKKYQDFEKYTGPEFNSSLWVEDDINKLRTLIESGLQYK